jgi:predicted DsbA family dithiol-disulfide isomerase
VTSTSTQPSFAPLADRVTIDVWSDVICPFCFLGDTLLREAVERFKHPVEVRYHSFQLMPELPAGPGRGVVEVLAENKGISPDQARAMNEQVAARGASLGLDMDFDHALVANTRDAHRLIHLAADHGLQRDMAQRLFRAYFTEGRDLGSTETLLDLAAEVGLERSAAAEVLAGDELVDAVQADIDWARSLGIGGVPFFVLDGRYGVSGAQPAEVFDQALATAWAARTA